jgi:hypothetical protein
MHREARTLLVEQKMERLFHLRIAANDNGKYYEDEVNRLEGQLDAIRPHVPVTPDQAAQNRKDLAATLGLRPRKG